MRATKIMAAVTIVRSRTKDVVLGNVKAPQIAARLGVELNIPAEELVVSPSETVEWTHCDEEAH